MFPTTGQTPAQQSTDEATCYNWAVQNTGTDPFNLQKQAQQQAQQTQQAQQQAQQAGKGAGAVGAVKGAAAGALIGGIAGDAGKGAAYGAAAGLVVGRARGRQAKAAGDPAGDPAGPAGAAGHRPADRQLQEGLQRLPRGQEVHGQVLRDAVARSRKQERSRGHERRDQEAPFPSADAEHRAARSSSPTTRRTRTASSRPIEQLRPPKGAPNVLVVLIDDAGFGSSSAFGGPCQTPNAEKLAAGGLKFNRFHTTAICSPTRQALLTGRNHHSAGMAGITEIATGAPGYSSVLPNSMSPLAKTLKLNGYNTAQFGKCHEVPVWQTSPVGPFDAWPTGGGGFEYFYGFIGGEANQWYPTLYEGTTPVEPEKTPEEGYHLIEDMTNKAIDWIAPAEGARPGQAVLHLLRAGRDPRAAPRAEGVGRQVQGQVRPGLGQAARGDLRPAEEAGRHPGRTASSPRAPRRSRPGTTCRRRSSRCCAARWRSTRASWSTPTTTWAGSSTC